MNQTSISQPAASHHVSDILSVFEHAALFIVALFAVTLVSVTPPQAMAQSAQSSVVINEIDRVTQCLEGVVSTNACYPDATLTSDAKDMVELKNVSNSNVSLDGYVLVVYDGLTKMVTNAIDLSGQSIGAGQYFVIGTKNVPNANLVQPNGWFKFTFVGGNGVALFSNSQVSDFMVGTSLTAANSSKIRDAVVMGSSGQINAQGSNAGADLTMISTLMPNSLSGAAVPEAGYIPAYGQNVNEITSVTRDRLQRYSVGRRAGMNTPRDISGWTIMIPSPGIDNAGNDNVSAASKPTFKVTATPISGAAGVATFNENAGIVYALITVELVGGEAPGPLTVNVRGMDSGLVVIDDQITIPWGSNSGSKVSPLYIQDNSIAPIDPLTYEPFQVWPPTYPSYQRAYGWVKIIDNDQNQPNNQNTTQNPIKINEVDRHTQELAPNTNNDALDFIELYNTSSASQSLDGYTVVLYEGLNNKVTDAFDLSGTISGLGYYVIGSPAVPNADMTRNVGNDGTGKWLQAWVYGGTGVALFKNSHATDFPVGSPLLSATDPRLLKLHDAVLVTYNGTPNITLRDRLTPGSYDAREGGETVIRNQSVGRKMDGSGELRSTAQWSALIPTPGRTNNGNDNIGNPAHPRIKVTVTTANSSIFTANENAGNVTGKVNVELVGATRNTPTVVVLSSFNAAVVTVSDTITIPAGLRTASKDIVFSVKDNSVQEVNGFTWGYFKATVGGTFEDGRGWIKILDNETPGNIPVPPQTQGPSATITANGQANPNATDAAIPVVKTGGNVTLTWTSQLASTIEGSYIGTMPAGQSGYCPTGNSANVYYKNGAYVLNGSYSEVISNFAVGCTMEYKITVRNPLGQAKTTSVRIKIGEATQPNPASYLYINNQAGTTNTSIGSTVRFTWGGTNLAYGYAMVEGTTAACGLGYPKSTSYINGASGSYDFKVQTGAEGCTYKYTFNGVNAQGGLVLSAPVYLSVASASSLPNVGLPTANLLANGSKSLVAYTGQKVTLSWSSTNAVTYKGRIESYDKDGYSCGSAQLGMNGANSSTVIDVLPGYAGCKFVYSVTMTNAAGQSVTSSVNVEYKAVNIPANPGDPVNTPVPNPGNTVALPTVTVLAGGQKEISSFAGDDVILTWSSANAVSIAARTEGFDSAGYSCGSSAVPLTTLSGAYTIKSLPGHAGCTVTYSITVKNSAGQSVTNSAKIKYSAKIVSTRPLVQTPYPTAQEIANGVYGIKVTLPNKTSFKVGEQMNIAIATDNLPADAKFTIALFKNGRHDKTIATNQALTNKAIIYNWTVAPDASESGAVYQIYAGTTIPYQTYVAYSAPFSITNLVTDASQVDAEGGMVAGAFSDVELAEDADTMAVIFGNYSEDGSPEVATVSFNVDDIKSVFKNLIAQR